VILVFPAGAGNGAVRCIAIPIVDDDLIEGTESFAVKLLLMAFPATLDLGDTSITIIDDEG
jgi:hypothetical protein